jgi:rRNA maturation protein Nop10
MEDDTEILRCIGETLEELRLQQPPTTEEKCPHCGLVIRFPIMARRSDIDRFAALMRSAEEVLGRHGITAHLLAEVRAQCLIALARRQQADEDPE